MIIEHQATIELKHDITWGDIVTAVSNSAQGANIPDDARMRVNHYAGDQREPSYTKLTFVWQEVLA